MLGTSSSCTTASRQVGHFRRRWLGSHALMVQRSQQTACPQGRKRTVRGRSMHTAQLSLSSSVERDIDTCERALSRRVRAFCLSVSWSRSSGGVKKRTANRAAALKKRQLNRLRARPEAVKSAAPEAANSSTRGSGWAPKPPGAPSAGAGGQVGASPIGYYFDHAALRSRYDTEVEGYPRLELRVTVRVVTEAVAAPLHQLAVPHLQRRVVAAARRALHPERIRAVGAQADW
eukprot:scaffold118259_cov66-Phaeocystis_antarctica.AAC.4